MLDTPIETILVPELPKRERLLEWAIGKFATISTRNGMKKAIKKGLLHVNQKQVNSATFIYGEETIDLFRDDSVQSKPQIDLELQILYEDDYLAVVYKPAGILVSGNKKWTLENALSSNLKQSSQSDYLSSPEPIHRLDYPTSGVLLIGKTISMVVKLNKLFQQREIQKTYFAVTIGNMEKASIIESRVGEKDAKTTYQVIKFVESERFERLNLVKLHPETGRKHQLRIHLSGIGNSILGDSKYGEDRLILKGKGLYLHAISLEFTHPATMEHIDVESELPKKFKKIFDI